MVSVCYQLCFGYMKWDIRTIEERLERDDTGEDGSEVTCCSEPSLEGANGCVEGNGSSIDGDGEGEEGFVPNLDGPKACVAGYTSASLSECKGSSSIGESLEAIRSANVLRPKRCVATIPWSSSSDNKR